MNAGDDTARVAVLLGRDPQGEHSVVVRDPDGSPVVIRNTPFLGDGTPMPTRYWLVGAAQRRAVDRLEAAGGVRRAEVDVPPAELSAAHQVYAAERDADIPPGWAGPRPSGGVGGTRRGVKCLHAHYAWYLAGGDDPVGRWVAARVAPVAAIDCGTNSTRLLVASPDGVTIDRRMVITRLGEGVDRTGTLAGAAISRTLAVLEEYRAVMDSSGVTRARMTATSAARDATNREAFLAAAEAVVGTVPELLSGDEEGRLSYVGAVADLDPASGPWLVADLGGGSTELAAGTAPAGPVVVRSLDVGCVRVTERFLVSDPPTPEELAAARAHVAAAVRAALDAAPGLAGGGALIGLAGTVAALAAVDQGLDHYDRVQVHHYVLTRDTVEATLATLAAEPASARRSRPGVEDQRADVLVGGTVVLAEIMAQLGFDRCLSSEADILDGLARSLLA